MAFKQYLLLAAALFLVVAGYASMFRLLPPRVQMEKTWDVTAGRNWFGQGGAAPTSIGVGLLIAFYAVRYAVLRTMRDRLGRAAWYAVACGLVLPAIWFLVVTDWDNESVSESACWIGYPVALLVVPTAFFCLDLWAGWLLSPGRYVLRSALEILCLVPAWMVCWGFFEFLALGWVGP